MSSGDEGLFWFPCRPVDLLNSLAGMSADEQLAFVTAKLRVHETGGPIKDDERAMARRTGTTPRRMTAAMERLFTTGDLIRVGTDGSFTVKGAQEMIDGQRKRFREISKLQTDRAKSGWDRRKKDVEKQQTDDAGGMPDECPEMPKDAESESEIEIDKKKKDSLVPSSEGTADDRKSSTKKSSTKLDRYRQPYSEDFEKFWAAYPPRAGSRDKKEASVSFQSAIENGINKDVIISGAQRYCEEMRRLEKLKTEYVKLAVTWLNHCCWDDYAPGPKGKTLFDTHVFVREGTPEFVAWKENMRARGLSPTMSSDPTDRSKQGSWFPTREPPAPEIAAAA